MYARWYEVASAAVFFCTWNALVPSALAQSKYIESVADFDIDSAQLDLGCMDGAGKWRTFRYDNLWSGRPPQRATRSYGMSNSAMGGG